MPAQRATTLRRVPGTPCYYCDQIRAVDPAYGPLAAEFDVGSNAPRCWRHWRYVCGRCGQPSHFMAAAYCTARRAFFCADCATGTEEVSGAFWCWDYAFRYRSPWSNEWCASLDRLEFDGIHPLQRGRPPAGGASDPISRESVLTRYPRRGPGTHRVDDLTDADVVASWNRNADRWDAGYDDDGDRNRKYQSDEPMLALLGDVRGRRVLDAGSGNGYLSRKLARAGATMTGVELSDRFHEIATTRERQQPLGIAYHNASVSTMPFLASGSFDKAVSNYVLMDVRDYAAAAREVHRVLKPGGTFVAVIGHPCFQCGPDEWYKPAPDSPRLEDAAGWLVDRYFHRGPTVTQWGDFAPITGFHRPLRDYWETFRAAGFRVEGFEEPSVTERGRRELRASRVARCLRVPYSCIFQLVKRMSPT
jgi:SAM-dependent methyltransferase